ncbi:MAG: hypothetical protein ACW964_01665 [Candidatus Hodarchaeales archaeon]|jgi:hypothetical protein
MRRSKPNKLFTALFFGVLTLTFFVNAVPVKADPPAYIIEVYTYQLHTHDDVYDPGDNGEFRFRVSFESDHSPYYTNSQWTVNKWWTVTSTEYLYTKAMDGSDSVYCKMFETDAWPGSDDLVIDWKSVQVSALNYGNNYITFSPDVHNSGLYCRLKIIKSDNPYH